MVCKSVLYPFLHSGCLYAKVSYTLIHLTKTKYIATHWIGSSQLACSSYFGTKVQLSCFRFPSFVRNTPLLLVSVTSFLMAWKSITEPGRCISFILNNPQHSGECMFWLHCHNKSCPLSDSAAFSAKAVTVLMVELLCSCTIVLLTCSSKLLHLAIMLCKSCIIQV